MMEQLLATSLETASVQGLQHQAPCHHEFSVASERRTNSGHLPGTNAVQYVRHTQSDISRMSRRLNRSSACGKSNAVGKNSDILSQSMRFGKGRVSMSPTRTGMLPEAAASKRRNDDPPKPRGAAVKREAASALKYARRDSPLEARPPQSRTTCGSPSRTA